jgi:c-di-AMP phosphodiesterase-like protein
MKTGVKFGIIGALIVIIWSLIAHFAGLSYNNWVSWISTLLQVIIFVLSCVNFKKTEGQGYMTLGEGMKNGVQTALIMAVIGTIWGIVYVKFINPEFMQHIMDMQITEMEKKGMEDEQIDQAMKIMKIFTSLPMLIIFGMLGTLFWGTITTLITSAIIKKEKPVDMTTGTN